MRFMPMLATAIAGLALSLCTLPSLAADPPDRKSVV